MILPSVTVGHIYLHSTVMWPSNNAVCGAFIVITSRPLEEFIDLFDEHKVTS